jgi:hypothetical protein
MNFRCVAPCVRNLICPLVNGLLFALLFRAAFAQQSASDSQGQQVPAFTDYRVQEVFQGKLALIDPRSHPWATKFRTVLTLGARLGPNFAGHYTLIDWGCGTSCRAFAIVDAKSGQVFAVSEATGGVPPASVGFKFQVDSELLIVNPIEVLEAEHPESILRLDDSRFYVWDKNHLKQIYTLSPTRPGATK